MERYFRNSDITLFHFLDDDKYYISQIDLKRSLACRAKIKVKQEYLKLDIYGIKDSLLDTYYQVFNYEYPDNVNINIQNVEKPIVLYQLMEDVDIFISEIDYQKSLEKGADVAINYDEKYCAPIVDNDSFFYKINECYFPDGVDIRLKRISKYYLEKTRRVK